MLYELIQDVERSRNMPLANHLQDWGYLCAGLSGEVGEFIGEVKPAIRASCNQLDPMTVFNKKAAIDELGDVLWYVIACANQLDVHIDEVAHIVLTKLVERRLNGGKK